MQGVEFFDRTGNGADVEGMVGAGDEQLPRTLDLVLDPPLEFSNGRTYDSMHLEEPTAKMVRTAEQELTGDYGPHHQRNFQIKLVELASGIPRGAIEQMRISQLLEAYNFLRRWSGHGPAIGQI